MRESAVFIDANALIYYLDATSDWHQETVMKLQELVDAEVQLYTSHHVLEEVLYIVFRISGKKTTVNRALRSIEKLPLGLVEPEADIAFAHRYTERFLKSSVGINDTLILQLLIDAGIRKLFTYDEALRKAAR